MNGSPVMVAWMNEGMYMDSTWHERRRGKREIQWKEKGSRCRDEFSS